MTTSVSQAKECTKCGETKALTEYPVDRHRPDGHRAVCRPCWNAGRSGGRKAAATPTEPHKVCGTCKADKPLTAYPVDRARPDGYRSQCRECMNAVDKARAERRKAEAATAEG